MTIKETTPEDLHTRIAALLTRRTTGNAVARELNMRYAAWQLGATGDRLPSRRSKPAMDASADVMFPTHNKAEGRHP